MHIFYFSGFACNGKTTLIKIASGFIPKEYRVLVTDEVARNVNELRSYFSNLGNLSNEKLEMEILAAEHEMLYFMLTVDNRYVLLKDRPIMDVLTFMVLRNMATLDDVHEYMENIAIPGDMIFLIRPTHNKEFIEKCMGDKLRKQTLENFYEMQDKFYDIWWKIYDMALVHLQVVEVDHPADNPSSQLYVVSKIMGYFNSGRADFYEGTRPRV